LAGNRATYKEALEAASAHTTAQRWEEAAVAYHRALAEFPDDPAALSGLGLTLSNLGRHQEALQALQRAAKASPRDPIPLELGARVLEKMGRRQEAAQAYLAAAERYDRQKTPDLAVERWKDAARVAPHSIPPHVNLLRVYLSQRKADEALVEYTALARIYLTRGQTEQALDICNHALQLDPNNSEILSLMKGLGQETESPPEDIQAGPSFKERESSGLGSPAEATRQKALADLAEAVFGEVPPQTGPLVLKPLSKREVDTLISKALDFQTLGKVEEAVNCYEKVLQAGVIQPAVNFNLGLLYQQQLRFEEAIPQFQQAVTASEYRLGSLFALGECYRALGRIDEALTHFIEVLKILDLGTVRREQADDLIHLYEELARTHAAKGEREQADEFVNSLISFLSEKGWEDKVVQARERLDTLASEGPILSLAEMLSVPGSERILQSIGLAQEYQRRGMKYAAIDELGQAMLQAPTFLPLHWQMGETLVSMGKTDQAVAKFLSIADVYQVEGKFSQAMAMYERALRLAPMNVSVRAKLIDLLISHGEIDRAMEHYMALGDTYYQMAQLDRAREKYDEALQLAPRGSPERHWEVRFLHRTGDIYMQQVNWQQATAVYERIRDLAPNDEKAHISLISLYDRLGQPERAVAELDSLLHIYRQAGKDQKAIAILQEQVQEHPDSIPLRGRLAQAYLNEGNKQKALQHLDTLGELQVQAGREQDAIATINAILRLAPPNADAYRQVLAQLTAKQGGG